MKAWVLVPVKAFAHAKTRLAGILMPEERAALAACMARDVLAAVRQARAVAGCTVLGGRDAQQLAAELGMEWLDDGGEPGLSIAVNAAARTLADRGVRTLLVVPADLPGLTGADIDDLLARHTDGLTLCPAAADGGSNALVVSPADGLQFSFGPDSAARHLALAAAAGLATRRIALPAFARDIDRPDDLQAFCADAARCGTGAWLQAHAVADRLTPPAARTA